jgi:hypothetical protein
MGGLFSKNKTIKFFSNKTINEYTEVKYFFNSEGQYKLKIDMNANIDKSTGSGVTIKVKNEKNNLIPTLYFQKSIEINTELGNYPYIFEGQTEVIIQINIKQQPLFVKKISVQQIPLKKSNFGSSENNNYLYFILLLILLLCYKKFVN